MFLASCASSDLQTNSNSKPTAIDDAYAKAIAGTIRKNIFFPQAVAGNPTVSVEIRTFSDGGIIGRRVLKSSGSAEWDKAVLRAIDRVRDLPLNSDGKAISPVYLSVSVKE